MNKQSQKEIITMEMAGPSRCICHSAILREQDKRSPNRPRLAGIRQINFAVNHTFEELNRNFNSFKMPDLV